jgi:hypothetical protein
MTHASPLLAVAAAAAMLAGCAGTEQKPAAPAVTAAPASAAAPAPAAAPAAATEYYVVLPEDGRYYAFGRWKDYADYMAHGEVTLTRARIGAGPAGRTLVFGITSDDVKSGQPSVGELVYDGKLGAAEGFYGEVFKDGRYYVFGDLANLKSFAAFGEVPYSFTDIGAGPKGETLVWVMTSESYKKGRPTATIDRFKQLRTASK